MSRLLFRLVGHVTLLLWLLSAGHFASAAPATAADRAALAKCYRLYDDSLAKQDLETAIGLEAADFTHTLRSGKVQNRREADETFRRAMRTLTIVSAATSVGNIAAVGNTLTTVVKQTVIATVVDAQGKKHRIVDVSSSRDTWVRTAGSWKIRHSEDLTDLATIDGHHLPT